MRDSALVSTSKLASWLKHQQDVKVLDASWHMPSAERSGYQEFLQEHIPGSGFFDIDAISDKASPYPHMLPSTEQFADAVSKLGIFSTDKVVIYDSIGIFSAPRVWWMFRVFGHQQVFVLDGGLPKWKSEHLPVASGTANHSMGRFTAHFQPDLLRIAHDIKHNLATKNALIVDARSAARFLGTEPEPRAGLRSGHIPGSKNLPWQQCLNQPTGTFKSTEELAELFNAQAIETNQSIITSCGSGISACILALALYELGNHDVAVYDGSWAEWGNFLE